MSRIMIEIIVEPDDTAEVAAVMQKTLREMKASLSGLSNVDWTCAVTR